MSQSLFKFTLKEICPENCGGKVSHTLPSPEDALYWVLESSRPMTGSSPCRLLAKAILTCFENCIDEEISPNETRLNEAAIHFLDSKEHSHP